MPLEHSRIRPSWFTAVALAVALLSAAAQHARAQAAAIVGQVTDARNAEGIAGVSVEVQGTRIGATTRVDGRYRITGVPAGTYAIVARRIGYASGRQSATVAASGDVTANFSLAPAAVSLDQVVVTGTAGAQEKRTIATTVSTINAPDQLEASAAPNITGLINGRAPGVVISATTGRIGAGPDIQIRGRSSLSLSNAPLIYIDGVRINNATKTGPSGVSGVGSSFGAQNSNVAGRLNDISPDDIESIEIIKGPAASTIYGTEAANGVIQIITKRGASGDRPQVSLQVTDGSIFFRDAEGRIATNYAMDKSGNVQTWNGVQTEKARGTPLFHTGQSRLYNASVSGGRNELKYYVSSSYQNDLGVEPNNSMRQFGVHANLSANLTPKTDFAASLNFVDLSSHLGDDSGASAMLGAEVGHILAFPATRGFGLGFLPEITQQYWDNADGINRFTGSGTLTNQLTRWFTQRAIVGIDYTGEDARAIERFLPPDLAKTVSGNTAGGRIGQTLRHNSIVTADYNGTAKVDLMPMLSSATSVGGQYYRTELNGSTLGGQGFPGPGVETVSGVAQPALAQQGDTLNTTIGAYVQQQFGWRDRVFLTGAVRVDNNSAFGSQFKWITYPKVGATWVVNEEPFWRWKNVVNALKLRAAYGESGRQPQAFAALRTFLPVPGPLATNAITTGNLGNPNLKPERGKELEAGFEANVLDRLSLDFTYYSKHTTDEIVSEPVAPSSGFAGTQFLNLGRVDNHGIELGAQFQAIQRNRFSWEITGNLGTNKDVVRSLGGLPSPLATPGAGAGQYNVVGYPINGIFVRPVVYAERNPAGSPAGGWAKNLLCAGATKGSQPVPCGLSAPLVFLGTYTPKVTGSISNDFTFAKRFRLHALVDFKNGYKVYNANDNIRCTALVGVPLCRENYFPNEATPIQLAEMTGTATAFGMIDEWMQPGSFAKLREISATYTLPENLLRGFSRASFTVAGRELHTWTRYKGIDPESQDNNGGTHDQAVVPPLTRILATLNFTF
jgi:TonB-linked SusC/RagA family outer membrane protein